MAFGFGWRQCRILSGTEILTHCFNPAAFWSSPALPEVNPDHPFLAWDRGYLDSEYLFSIVTAEDANRKIPEQDGWAAWEGLRTARRGTATTTSSTM